MRTCSPVPEGFRTVTAFLNLKQAARAVDFYARAFGAVQRGRLLGGDGAIVHCELVIGDSVVFVAESVNDPPTSSTCHLYVDDVDAWWARAIDAGARVVVALADVWWGERFGMVADDWGTHWAIRSRREELSWSEMQQRLDALASRRT